MQPADQVALPDHLQVVHDVVVAFFLGLPRLAPSGRRMGPGGKDSEPVFASHRRDGPPQVAQFSPRVGHVVVRRGDHLDLRLQELRRDAAGGGSIGGFQEGLRHFAYEGVRLGIDQEILLFDAKCECTGHSRGWRLGSSCEDIIH